MVLTPQLGSWVLSAAEFLTPGAPWGAPGVILRTGLLVVLAEGLAVEIATTP